MTLLIGESYRDRLAKPLAQLGQRVLWMPDNPALDPRIAGHADLSVFRADERTLVVGAEEGSLLVKELTNREPSILSKGYTIITVEQGAEYPNDAGLCVCQTGKFIIYNPKTAAPAIKPYLRGTRIEVSQGYTKCSVCAVTDDSIITADPVIASRASEAGMDVLEIRPGYIKLDGFDYGFIGGASFLLHDDSLAFTGTLEHHPDRERIHAFLRKHGVEPVFLSTEPIFDVGGAIAL